MADDRPLNLKDWLCERGLDVYWAMLDGHEIDIHALFELEYAHLQEMGFSVGARLKILKAVSEHLDQDTSGRGGIRVLAPPCAKAAERRQITAMFCDIVGYTNLSSRIDPEETRRLLHGYWRRIQEIASIHQGHIAQYLGDGALIYFGYPSAREDDAERAVTAALDLLKIFEEAGKTGSMKLHIRVGVATGIVVVGDDRGSRRGAPGALAIGHTVNLAARLQTLALPGHVVVDESTRQLVGALFQFESLGPMDIAGFGSVSSLYTVTGARQVRTRFEARHPETHAEVFGRADEMSAALELWRGALDHQGQMLLVEGEPGIGKSHFAWGLARKISEDGFDVLQLQCSPRHIDSPFYPSSRGFRPWPALRRRIPMRTGRASIKTCSLRAAARQPTTWRC